MGTQNQIMRILFIVGFSLGAFGLYTLFEASQRQDDWLQIVATFILLIGAVVAITSWSFVSRTTDDR